MGRLFWKFFIFIMVAQLTAIIGVGIMFSFESRERSLRDTELDLSAPAATSVRTAVDTLQSGGVKALHEFILGNGRRRVYAVDELQRELLGRPVDARMLEEARAMLGFNVRRRVVEQVQADDGHSYLLFLPSPTYMDALQPVSQDTALLPAPAPPFFFPVMPMVVAAVASLFFAMLLAWYFSKPIRQLKSAFAQAASGNLNYRLAPLMGKRNDELADLGRHFDAMATKLRFLMESQRRLLHDVSHELRSPIARLQASIGLARMQPEKTVATLERIEREGMRMDKLVGELLTLSRLEADGIIVMMEQIHMQELLTDLINDARFEAEAVGRHVEGLACGNVLVRGDAELLYRAIENVVRNAIKQTGAGTTVTIDTSFDRDTKYLMIGVSDYGPGVPEDELQLIFEPFFRSIRTQKNVNGYGLGLTIARRIIEAHGGSIRALNQSTGGLYVDIALPYESIDA